ncbi:hypothetical protein GCM10029964_078410 [Kibdelosporangium lantanae]
MGELLRLATAGSVDDGKSTLVGRLLHDAKSVLADEFDAVRQASTGQDPDLSLLVDGLRAEREQGITIDVAYRYFATHRRSFILADTPGHVQYTRNTVTGASTAQLAVLLVDARRGVVEQTRRHATVLALLGVPKLVLAVNKIDLVGYDESTFQVIVKEFTAIATTLGCQDLVAIPVSALKGDNVAIRSANTPGTPGRRSSTTSKPCRCGQIPTTHPSGIRCSTSSGPVSTGATRDRSPRERSGSGTRSWCCRRGRVHI